MQPGDEPDFRLLKSVAAMAAALRVDIIHGSPNAVILWWQKNER